TTPRILSVSAFTWVESATEEASVGIVAHLRIWTRSSLITPTDRAEEIGSAQWQERVESCHSAADGRKGWKADISRLACQGEPPQTNRPPARAQIASPVIAAL